MLHNTIYLGRQWLSGKVCASQLEGWVFNPRPLRKTVALLGQERSPQMPRQVANFRLRPAAKCQIEKNGISTKIHAGISRGNFCCSPNKVIQPNQTR